MPKLGQGARDSTTIVALEDSDDAHLTWKNEALRETAEPKVDLEIVYPSLSKTLNNARFFNWLPTKRTFLKEDEQYSATIKAVREAYKL